MQTKSVQQVDWDTQRVVDGNTIENGGTTKRDNTMLITGMLDRSRHLTLLMILLTVSANDEVRDDLRNVVRGHLCGQVQFFELDYQPL